MTTASEGKTDDISVRVLDIADGVDSIFDDWLELSRHNQYSTIFQSPVYFSAYAAAFGAARKSEKLAVIHRGDEVLALFPLRKGDKTRFGLTVRMLEFADTPIPLHDAILSPEIALEYALEILCQKLTRTTDLRWDVIKLNGVLEDNTTALGLASGGSLRRLSRHVNHNNYLDLSGAEFFQDKSRAKLRRNIRRSKRKLAELGEISFESIDELPALEKAFMDFLDIEASGWKSRRGGKRAVKLNEDMTCFFSNLMRRFGASGDCHIHLLRLDGKTIAANFSIQTGATVFSLKSGYDESLSKIAPGQILREYIVNHYSADPTVERNDLISDYQWQVQWRPVRRKVFDVYFFNRSFFGWLTYVLMKVSFALKEKRSKP